MYLTRPTRHSSPNGRVFSSRLGRWPVAHFDQPMGNWLAAKGDLVELLQGVSACARRIGV